MSIMNKAITSHRKNAYKLIYTKSTRLSVPYFLFYVLCSTNACHNGTHIIFRAILILYAYILTFLGRELNIIKQCSEMQNERDYMKNEKGQTKNKHSWMANF